MKRFKWESWIVALVVTAISTLGFSGFAFGNPPETSKTNSPDLRQEKAAINKDLAAINLQQEKVKLLEKQYRKETAGGAKSGLSYSELMKAKADLQRDRAYLNADKKDLLKEHRAFISERKKDVRAQRTGLWSTQLKAMGSLLKGKPAAVGQAKTVVDAKHELKQNASALKQAKLNRNSDLLLVNKEIRDAKGQNALALSVEDAAAKTQNFALKTVK